MQCYYVTANDLSTLPGPGKDPVIFANEVDREVDKIKNSYKGYSSKLVVDALNADIAHVKEERDSYQRVGIEVQTTLENFEREISAALPGARYMDPPDGGDVSLGEQVRRMAQDVDLITNERDTLKDVLTLLAPDLKVMAQLYTQNGQHERAQALAKIAKSVGVE